MTFDSKYAALGLLAIVGLVWVASGTQRARPVLDAGQDGKIRALEAEASKQPADGKAVRALAQGYLDARLPGMAFGVLDHAPPSVKVQPESLHLLAGVLLEQGKVHAALDAETAFQKSCEATQDPACTPFLEALAERRVSILKELVRLGVEDAMADPEKTRVAHQHATRTVTLPQ
jgi:hypothetical protein